MPMLREGESYPAVVEGYASGGEGVARIGGMAVFVKGALRGERVEVFIEHIGHSAAWGRVERLTEPSPARIEPDCPYYGVCGGCQFRHMTYGEELEAKRQRVEDALRRIGGVELPVSVIHGAENTLRYRNKVQFPAAPGPKIGFYKKGTHAVIEVEDCLLQPVAAARLRGAVKEWMLRRGVRAYDERVGKGLVRHVYVRANRAGQSLCCLVVNAHADCPLPFEEELIERLQAAEPGLAGVMLSANRERTNVVLGRELRTLWGQDFLDETLCALSFRLSVPSFFQVNRDQAEVLYRRVLDFAGLTGGETVVELYCGIGTISLTLAERSKQVIGVEVVPQAVEDAKENARRNGLARKTRFECGDAAELAAKLETQGVRPDIVVVDPPRKGLAPEVVDAIAKMAPDRVVYVSCDPATLARDVKQFGALGYAPARAEAVDLFPRTAHVETAVLMSKNGAPGFFLK